MTSAPETFDNPDLYAVLHALPSGVTLARADGRIVFSNAAADRILGVSAATQATPSEWTEHYGVFLPDGATPFPTDQYPLLRALAGEPTSDVEMVIRNAAIPEGSVILVSGRPLRDAEDHVKGAVVIFRDVTQLRKAEKMKEELAAFVVHDLKTPLATVLAACDMMEASALADDTRADVVTIRAAAERMKRMLLDLLALQMAEDGALTLERSPVALDALMDEVVEAGKPRLEGRGQRLTTGPTGGLSVLGDRPHLFRVLMNLVDNCAKYGPEGGLVSIDVAPLSRDRTAIRVSDEGPGVPAALRERIFDKYAQAERGAGMRSRDSRGLGLRFCRVIVEAHGGRIWVEDAQPRGARFVVELPLA